MRIAVLLLLGGGLLAFLDAADSTAPAADPTADPVAGVWVYVGTPGHVGSAPQSGGRLKFRMSGRWTYTEANPDTRAVKAHFGGTYRVSGNDYRETIDYSTDPDDSELGNTLRFTVKVDSDTMTQTGVGNPYTEVWKRIR